MEYNLLIILLVVTVAILKVDCRSDLETLNDTNFDKVVSENEPILVTFFSKKCYVCRNFEPEFNAASEKLAKQNIKFSIIDTDANPMIMSKLSITDLPYTLFFYKGKRIVYTAGFSRDNVINWVEKRLKPSSKHLNTIEEIKVLEQKEDMLLLYLSSDHDSSFFEIAYELQNIMVAHCFEDECLKHFNVEREAVIIFKKFGDRLNFFNQELNLINLNKFIEANRYPSIVKFDKSASQRIFGKKNPGIFFIYNKSENDAAIENIISEVALQFQGVLITVTADINEELEKKLIDYLGLELIELPSVWIVDPANESKFKLSGEISAEKISAFVDDWQNNRLQKSLKSAPVPKSQDSEVIEVVGSTFNSIVLDESKDVLIEIYAPWCQHCQKFAPDYENLAHKLKNNKNLVIARMDGSANETDKLKFSSYPSLFFFPAEPFTTAQKFQLGDRTYDNLVQFIKTNSKHEIIEKNTDKSDL